MERSSNTPIESWSSLGGNFTRYKGNEPRMAGDLLIEGGKGIDNKSKPEKG